MSAYPMPLQFSKSKSVINYFKRFASDKPIINEKLDPSCRIIVVIPCYNEPDLIGTLESLKACTSVNSLIEIIVVVNNSVDSHNEIKDRNSRTIIEFKDWNDALDKNFKFHLIQVLDLPKKTAGVGLARKIGMDEALRRFVSIDFDGVIVCLDADCRVSKNYLKAITYGFLNTDAGIGEVYFEHPFEQQPDPLLCSGIINYELFLRYYVEGLRQSGFPNAIQTIGSCMLVKSSVYAKHGGMNKRKAGEDFYFLHKIVPHEKFKEVNEATVYPSSRTSDRVPFGTGKAQQGWLDKEDENYLTYDPRIFSELKLVLESVDMLFETSTDLWVEKFFPHTRQFFEEHGYVQKIDLIKRNCKTHKQFLDQFYVWFDGFLCLKFVHYLRDQCYANIPMVQAAEALIDQSGDVKTLLSIYRKMDRN